MGGYSVLPTLVVLVPALPGFQQLEDYSLHLRGRIGTEEILAQLFHALHPEQRRGCLCGASTHTVAVPFRIPTGFTILCQL